METVIIQIESPLGDSSEKLQKRYSIVQWHERKLRSSRFDVSVLILDCYWYDSLSTP